MSPMDTVHPMSCTVTVPVAVCEMGTHGSAPHTSATTVASPQCPFVSMVLSPLLNAMLSSSFEFAHLLTNLFHTLTLHLLSRSSGSLLRISLTSFGDLPRIRFRIFSHPN